MTKTVTQKSQDFRADLSYVRSLFNDATSRTDGTRASAADMNLTRDMRDILREMGQEKYRKSICGKSKRTIAAWMYHFSINHFMANFEIDTHGEDFSEEIKTAIKDSYMFCKKWSRYFAADLGLEMDDLWQAAPGIKHELTPLND